MNVLLLNSESDAKLIRSAFFSARTQLMMIPAGGAHCSSRCETLSSSLRLCLLAASRQSREPFLWVVTLGKVNEAVLVLSYLLNCQELV
jgi:hypothetical protein